MIAGRLRWRPARAKLPKRRGLYALRFSEGTLLFTEECTKNRASIHVVRGEMSLREHDPGGLEIFGSTLEGVRTVLASRNHTLKRALTDPHLFSGIGNAYSDEILHRARLSLVRLTQKLKQEEVTRLFGATQRCLEEWTERLRSQVAEGFLEKVTAFQAEMRCRVATENLAPSSSRRCSVFCTPRTRRTTAPSARRRVDCSRTALCPDS